MHADFSVELGRDDPALEIPWKSDDGAVRYYDLRRNPEAIAQIPEAVEYPELSAFLKCVNASDSHFETAKCDVWQSNEMFPEEEIFGAETKFVSYVDLVFVKDADRNSFVRHEKFARDLCALLSRAPDVAATVELIVRRCHCHQLDTPAHIWHESSDHSNQPANSADASVSGFYLTAYITGFGNEDCGCRRAWEIAISLLQYAILQLNQGQ